MKEILDIDTIEFQRIGPDFLRGISQIDMSGMYYKDDKFMLFYPESVRKKLIIDPDKCLFDVVHKDSYQMLTPKHT